MFWKRKSWEDEYDDNYSNRPIRKRVDGPVLWIHLCFLAVLFALILGGVWSVAGRTMLEKSLKELVTPIGIVWLFLLLQIYFAAIYRQGALFFCGLIAVLTLTIGGNYFVVRALVHSIERDFFELDPFQVPPYDAVIVLGGGSEDKPNGLPQLTRAGERIAMAAKLYHAGQTQQIITSGTATFSAAERDQHPCEEARQILIQLNIPEDQIVMLRGDNTHEESVAIKKWLDQRDEEHRPARIGLITSAWHLKRALKLFERQSVQVEPVPADFMRGPFRPNPSMIIPTADNLNNTATIIFEHLGRAIGR